MPNVVAPIIDQSTLTSFAVVIGTEVAFAMKYPPEVENVIAALRSNPQIIEVPDHLKQQVGAGWTFDGENFFPPEE